MLNCPPMSGAASNNVTRWPRSAAFTANARPAGPAPTTAIFFVTVAGINGIRVSWQARGLTRHEVTLPTKIWSRQAWLQPIQVLISSSRPLCALLSNSASARNGRAIETISASPAARIASATVGSLIRLVVTSGTVTRPLSLRVTQLNAPRGTGVAMVGMRASCQPIPVLMRVAPAASMAFASVTVSSNVAPPSTKSSIDRR